MSHQEEPVTINVGDRVYIQGQLFVCQSVNMHYDRPSRAMFVTPEELLEERGIPSQNPYGRLRQHYRPGMMANLDEE